jgi:hypothetical protein
MGEVFTEFKVRKGSHIGRGHLLKFTNCQDAHALYEGEVNGKAVVIGIICDGCSEGTSSEVGAKQAVEFLVREALTLVQTGAPVRVIPEILYGQLIEFLRATVSIGYNFVSTGDKVNFIKNFLLFTVVGFITLEDEGVLFVTGDGTFVIYGEATFIDQKNMPTYPAYHLVERSRLTADASELPTSFDVHPLDMSTLERLAIGSDAWQLEQALLNEVWGFTNPAGLQRKINLWSRDKHFEDDVTLITVEVVRQEIIVEEVEEDSGEAIHPSPTDDTIPHVYDVPDPQS